MAHLVLMLTVGECIFGEHGSLKLMAPASLQFWMHRLSSANYPILMRNSVLSLLHTQKYTLISPIEASHYVQVRFLTIHA